MTRHQYDQDARIAAYQAGASVEEVAKQFARPEHTIHSVLHRAQIPLRARYQGVAVRRERLAADTGFR